MGPRSRRSRFKGFLGVSLLLHGALVLGVAAFLSINPDGCSKPAKLPLSPFEISLVPDKDLDLEAKLQELKKEELKKEEAKEDKDVKGQVVEIPRPAEEKHPDKARFLSEYDSSVEKETKGPTGPFRPGQAGAERPAQQRPARPSPPPQPQQQEEGKQAQPGGRKVMKLAMRPAPELPKSDLPRSEGGDEPARIDGHQPQGPEPREGPEGRGESAAPGKRKLSMKDLALTDSELGRAVGGGTQDYLKDVEEGSATLLNTKRWRFATFFNRVKRQVAQNWHPDTVYRRRDPTGNVYGFRDRLTILRVRLTPQGRLKELHLEKPCGVGFLDDEAIAAFRAAEPFPNPPPGLVDKETGMISFRFGFLFEISARPGFRIFRYND